MDRVHEAVDDLEEAYLSVTGTITVDMLMRLLNLTAHLLQALANLLFYLAPNLSK